MVACRARKPRLSHHAAFPIDVMHACQTGPSRRVAWRSPDGARWLLASLGIVCLHAAQAQVSGALGVSSDNVYRGVSLTDGRPAWLADLHYDLGSGWTTGVGASAEHLRHQKAGAQLTAYLDHRWQLGEDWAARAGVVHYDSQGNARSGYWRYDEITAAVGYRGEWTATLAVSPNRASPVPSRRGRDVVSGAFELTWHRPIGGRWSGDLGAGYADLDASADVDYRYASAGLSYALADARFYLLALWTGPVTVAYAEATDARLRWVGSIVWSF
jgi:uncharacterized protein (TIGR02001 family)